MSRDALTADAPSPPEGSKIRVQATSSALVLQWRTPRRVSASDILIAIAMFGSGLMLLPWLGAFMATRFSVVGSVLAILWNGGLTLVLAWIFVTLVSHLRGRGPERVILTDESFCYVPGTVWTWKDLRRRLGSEASIPWHQLASLELYDGENRQRLMFYCAPKWVEIGEHLSHAEREWLLQVIVQRADERGYR